ncbi:phospholipase effector Tle1 domain-containing protein [Gordonia sp. 'Campus']|uniref:phospholipase effector Tle1 domain-containing protein n=1 Tax=Gordonia sp. 'Campus' TaxID=2915824 RepID=UPI001EE3A70F|nr:DUF2235 domain-containing protein [Gordonia sp. 'Campus']
MKKRLVVCCDGTWMSSLDPLISNVLDVARRVTTTQESDEPADRVVDLPPLTASVRRPRR